jgi:HAD superfamily phosphoserine phosphatase-like hydrolase
MRLAIYTDFDGTITTRDCLDALVEGYIGTERRQAYDTMFLSGAHPLWEVIDASLRACSVSLPDAIRYLHETVTIDPTFEAFDAWCRAHAVPLEVVSAGVHEIVASFLDAAGLSLPIRANRAEAGTACFGLTPLESGCPTGVDKAAIVAAGREAGYTTVFVGDGFSDRLAVAEADLVYAKAGLARYCAKRGIPFVPFDRFDDVRRDLEGRLAAHDAERLS